MVAGLPKGPIEPGRSIGTPYPLSPLANQRGAPRQTRLPNAFTDASLSKAIGGFSLRGEARSIGT